MAYSAPLQSRPWWLKIFHVLFIHLLGSAPYTFEEFCINFVTSACICTSVYVYYIELEP